MDSFEVEIKDSVNKTWKFRVRKPDYASGVWRIFMYSCSVHKPITIKRKLLCTVSKDLFTFIRKLNSEEREERTVSNWLKVIWFYSDGSIGIKPNGSLSDEEIKFPLKARMILAEGLREIPILYALGVVED